MSVLAGGDDGSVHVSRLASSLAAALAVAGLTVAIVLDVLAGATGDGTWAVGAWVVATLSSTAVGLVRATPCPENRIGWLLLANGLVLTAMGVSNAYLDYAILAEPPPLRWTPYGLVMVCPSECWLSNSRGDR